MCGLTFSTKTPLKTAASTSSLVVLERKEYWKVGCCNIILKKLVGSSGQLVHLDEDKPEQLIDIRQLHTLKTLHPDEQNKLFGNIIESVSVLRYTILWSFSGP